MVKDKMYSYCYITNPNCNLSLTHYHWDDPEECDSVLKVLSSLPTLFCDV